MNIPKTNQSHDAQLRCSTCGVSFQLKKQKEEHLRLHCIVCNELQGSRDELLSHMKESHRAEAGTLYWPLSRGAVKRGTEMDEKLSDVLQYKREHMED